MFDCKFIAVLMIFIYKERERERERGVGGEDFMEALKYSGNCRDAFTPAHISAPCLFLKQ